MQYPYISMYSRSQPASTHSMALDGTVGERDIKRKISVQRARPGPLWRLHTRFDLIRTNSKRSGRRVGWDRRCRSPQLGFTTSQLRGCTPSSDSPSGGGRTVPRTMSRTALREDPRNSNEDSDSPSGGHSNSPSGRRSKLRPLYGVAHIRCQLSGRASPFRTSSCRKLDSLSALRNYFVGGRENARSCMACEMRARMKLKAALTPSIYRKAKG
jgi:hypothetical protein